jgi:hypothetical protein
MDLLYNNVNTGISNTALYNGNISAMRWSNDLGLGDTKERAYKFDYDPMNRLMAATQKTFDAITWSSPGAYQEGGVTYDLNGNIKTLLRTDEKGARMDSLTYSYSSGDMANNMLRRVNDSGTTKGFANGASLGDDYTYDANGNMISDKNKLITAITYNHLNLPTKVTKSTGDYITYQYDATGRKLLQDVYNPTNILQKRSDYRGEWFYERYASSANYDQVDHLIFANTEEGRVVMTGATPEYQYHLKDHLGNVRMTFTTKIDTLTYTATLENATQTQEQSNFGNYSRVQADLFDHTDQNGTVYTYSHRLTGATNSQVGLAKSFQVHPGDVINAQVFAKYFKVGNTSTNVAGFASALLMAFGLPTPGPGEVGTASSALNNFGAPDSGTRWT